MNLRYFLACTLIIFSYCSCLGMDPTIKIACSFPQNRELCELLTQKSPAFCEPTLENCTKAMLGFAASSLTFLLIAERLDQHIGYPHNQRRVASMVARDARNALTGAQTAMAAICMKQVLNCSAFSSLSSIPEPLLLSALAGIFFSDSINSRTLVIRNKKAFVATILLIAAASRQIWHHC